MAKLWAIIKREYLERVRIEVVPDRHRSSGRSSSARSSSCRPGSRRRSKATSDIYNTTILDATSVGIRAPARGQHRAVTARRRGRLPEVQGGAADASSHQAESTATHAGDEEARRRGYLVLERADARRASRRATPGATRRRSPTWRGSRVRSARRSSPRGSRRSGSTTRR